MRNEHAGKLAAWERANHIEHKKKKEETESPEITFPAAHLRRKAHQSNFD